jgi:hypothetical protein
VQRSGQDDDVSEDVLHGLADRLQADLRTRFPGIVVRLVKDEDGLWLWSVQNGPDRWGEVGTQLDEEDHLSPEEAEHFLADLTFDVADNLWPDELTDPWPVCPLHGDHPLNPRLAGGKAAWVCLHDSTVTIPVGGLGG